MATGVVSIAIGAILLGVGYRNWRLRNTETISLIEATILLSTGVDPLQRTATDKALA